MFLNNELSTTPVPSPYAGSGAEPLLSRTFDYEEGPIAEQDPTQGLLYQQWRAYIKDMQIWIEADNLPASILVPSEVDSLTDISIAFSHNAVLHYCWTDNKTTRLRYYDTLSNQMETMTLMEAVRTPKLTHDDKRPTQQGRSDIIFSYIKPDNKLYFRMQRDRFTVEYLLDDGPFISIERLYMNSGYRLQWLVTRGAV